MSSALPSPLIIHRTFKTLTSPLPQTLDSQHSTNPNPNPNRKPTLRSRISQLCKDGRLDAARRLFDSLPRPLPTLIWNTIIIGYVCNSAPRDALLLYSLMNSSSAAAHSDHYTYSSALKACADAGRLDLGKSIHCHILRRRQNPASPKNPILNNSLLNMYASALNPPCPDSVVTLFDRMPKRNVVAWNILISWCVKCRRFDDALVRLTLMMSGRGRVRPTVVTFINVFPAVAHAVDGDVWADTLYGLLVKHGVEYVSDAFVVSSAVRMYSELSNIESARRVFDCCIEKNIEVWNTMIGGYVQNGRFEEALALFVEILESDSVEADSVTFIAALMAVSQLQDVNAGQQIHVRLVKQGTKGLPLILYNSLIVMYWRCGSPQFAFELFDRMPERDVVSWNTMVSTLVQNGSDSEALVLVHKMQREGFSVDSVTVTALLSAASNLGSLRIGKETHGYLVRRRIQCQGLASYLIDMYAKSGNVDTARKLFDENHPDERDQVTWNAMIAGHMQNEQMEQALSLFREMLEDDQKIPNPATLSSILPACNRIGGIQAGKQIHGFAVRRLLDGNLFVGTGLVDMYSKCGAISYALRVFDKMGEKNTVTYTSMISGLGQHGLGDRALSLFRVMQESGTDPDAITFLAAVAACSYSGLVDEGLSVFKSMERFGIRAMPEHYCCVVDMLGRAGRLEEAYEFVMGLGDEGNFVGIWGSLLAACRVHGKYELGERVSERLLEFEGEDGAAGYRVLLSNVYAANGRWDNVDRVRKEMRERGLAKEPGFSWIGVGDTSSRFMSRDQGHPDNEQIYAMLDDLSLEMKRSLVDEPLDPW